VNSSVDFDGGDLIGVNVLGLDETGEVRRLGALYFSGDFRFVQRIVSLAKFGRSRRLLP
jgi:hypothetical protein